MRSVETIIISRGTCRRDGQRPDMRWGLWRAIRLAVVDVIPL